MAWVETLRHPPVEPISDRKAVDEALQDGLLQHLRAARVAHEQAATAGTAVPDNEDAPPGWDNATLLAEMQASARRG